MCLLHFKMHAGLQHFLCMHSKNGDVAPTNRCVVLAIKWYFTISTECSITNTNHSTYRAGYSKVATIL